MDNSYSNDRPFRSGQRGQGGDSYGHSSGRRSYGNDRPRHRDVRDEVYSQQVRAGKRRYFFDVRDTRSGDYYLTITEMKRAFEGDTPEKHKLFLYKEDFTKFVRGLQDTIDYIKSNLLTPEQVDELERGDAQYEEDERYYREQRQLRAQEDGYDNDGRYRHDSDGRYSNDNHRYSGDANSSGYSGDGRPAERDDY